MRLAILGVPSSIGARSAGTEGGPRALRKAELADRLRSDGHDLEDRGDQPETAYVPDTEPAHRKRQNVEGVANVARTLAPRVESALREGRLPLILGGDCTIALGSFAGAARVHRDLGLVYFDRDAELNTPQTTLSGILDGMVVAHLLGRGVPELARPEGGAPLLGPGRLALIGVDRLDPREAQVYDALPAYRLRSAEIRRDGTARTVEEILRRLAGEGGAFFIHFDLDVVDGSELPAVDFPAPGGLRLEEAQRILSGLVASPAFAGIEVTNFNPVRDPDGIVAARVVELIVQVFGGGDATR